MGRPHNDVHEYEPDCFRGETHVYLRIDIYENVTHLLLLLYEHLRSRSLDLNI